MNGAIAKTLAALAIATVGLYYLWAVRATGHGFEFGVEHNGYYNYLGRAFAGGRLYLAIEPARELLALPNPWDPKVDDSLKMHDMALFNRRYYLYHGAGPAVLLFAPWRIATRHDLPENFALFLLCFGGFLFSCGALWRLLELAGVKLGPMTLVAMLLALGVCQAVPYLLNRVWVYEIAIGGGYFCVSGGMFFLTLALESRHRARWLAASGLLFGLAISCRPHLGLAGVLALVAVAWRKPAVRELAAFAAPFALVGAAVAGYNYARFGNPFEFGVRYLLSGENQQRIRLAPENVLPGIYHFLFCRPEFERVFPWIRPVIRPPFDRYPFPSGYFIEPVAGALYLAPFVVLGLLAPRAGAAAWRTVMRVCAASSAAIVLFVAATGFVTERYLVDFLPLAVLAALVSIGVWISRSTGFGRAVLTAAFLASAVYACAANLALAITGPLDEMLHEKPARYLRIAGWFSPVESLRPLGSPAIEVEFTAAWTSPPPGSPEPLVVVEHPANRYFLTVERAAGKLRLVSRSPGSTVEREMDDPHRPMRFRVSYAPQTGEISVAADGETVLTHRVGTLVTAPAQVAVGRNRVDPGAALPGFSGTLRDARKRVAGTRE